jgi:glycosyltransferase involved in cell wall biosynthesis
VEALLASALVDAGRRKIGTITVFFDHAVDPAVLRRALSDPRIASVGAKEASFRSELPEDLREDRRVGRLWEPGAWMLPDPAEHVYFFGQWRRITPDMLREVIRRDVSSLRVRLGSRWASVPLARIRAGVPVLRAAHVAVAGARSATRFAIGLARRRLADALSSLRPGSDDLAARIAGPPAPDGLSLERAFEFMLDHRPPPIEAVPGRVVLVCGNLAPGGAERQVAYTLRGLVGQGFESVRLLCHHLAGTSWQRHDFYLPDVLAAGVKAREIKRRSASRDRASMPPGLREVAPRLPPALTVDIANLYWELAEMRPQVVHAWLDWDNVRAGFAAVLAGVPRVVISGRNLNPSHFALYQSYMDPAYRVLAQRPNVGVINNSRAGADDYADWIGIARDRIEVVHNAVDFGDRARPSSRERRAVRASFGIPADAFVVGGVFRLDQEKRPLLWIRTAALVAKDVPNARFLVFGQGPMRDEILRLAQREGVADRLTLPGVTDDVLAAMSIMDVFLLASFGEGLPNVVLEAQWAGTPVVVTDVGGAKEALEPGVTGWAIPTDEPQDLAAGVTWLHKHPEAMEIARSRGPAFVRERFGIDRMVAETIRIYGIGAACSLEVGRRSDDDGKPG